MKISLNCLAIICVYIVASNDICDGGYLDSDAFPWPSVSRPISHIHRRIPCSLPRIRNGYSLTFGELWSFNCLLGYTLLGRIHLFCNDGRFDSGIPVCGKPGCSVTQQKSNGLVQLETDRITLKLTCNDGFDLAGSETAYCDGREWDRELGECREDVGHTKVCDFETSNACGWTHDERENDFPWRRRNGWNAIGKLKFGPKHDHTTGRPLEGHYMVAQAVNSPSEQKAYFWSPIHSQADSRNACFRFFYHMYGAYVGRLRVLLKPIDKDIDEVVNNTKFIYFENRYSSNEWYEGFFQLNRTTTDFQIVFEATVEQGRISDIAIDDVALLSGTDCGADAVITEAPMEEAGGIYDIQSCENRCMETESKFVDSLVDALNSDSHQTKLIEICDCHPDCSSMETCCPDYPLKCGEIIGVSTVSMDIITNYVPTEKTPQISEERAENITKVPMPTESEATILKSPITITLQPMASDKNSTHIRSPDITNIVRNELRTASESHHMQTITQLSPSMSENNHMWMLAACGLLISCIFVTVIGWRHYQRKNNLSSHQITYKSEGQTHDLQIEFNGKEALINGDVIDEEPNNESTKDSKSNEQNAKVNIPAKMRQYVDRSQQSLSQYWKLNDQKHRMV